MQGYSDAVIMKGQVLSGVLHPQCELYRHERRTDRIVVCNCHVFTSLSNLVSGIGNGDMRWWLSVSVN